MAWDNVKFYDFSNEAYFEKIGPLVQKLLAFVRLGFKWEHVRWSTLVARLSTGFASARSRKASLTQ